jgi:hypothetical protein
LRKKEKDKTNEDATRRKTSCWEVDFRVSGRGFVVKRIVSNRDQLLRWGMAKLNGGLTNDDDDCG